MRTFVLFIGLLAVPASAVAQDQFDLVCEGQYRERVNARLKPSNAHYRIDLAAGAWCIEKCAMVQQIQTVEPGKIVFSQGEEQAPRWGSWAHEIDRTTGKYRSYRNSAAGFWEEEGDCQLTQFSGFPDRKF